jgi:hypothetical protein
LSRPFQANVPPSKLFTADRSVAELLHVIDRLDPPQSGKLLAWDGAVLPF